MDFPVYAENSVQSCYGQNSKGVKHNGGFSGGAKHGIYQNDEKTVFTRYFITSLTDINEFAYAVRKHWSIENQLHWCLDVIFREDAARARKDNSPLNMNVLRKTALSLVTQAQYGRISKKKLMFKAALNPDIFLSIIFSAKK